MANTNEFTAPSYDQNRWKNVKRNYNPKDVALLQGSVEIDHSLAKRGSERLWTSLKEDRFVASLGAFTGNQAIQQVKAGLRAIYLSGWQVAADANNAGQMYPDQSLYPADSVPSVVTRINKALLRADQIQTMENQQGISKENLDYLAPIVADAEAGFGGVLNAYELMKSMIEAGAAGVHFEDQLAAEKKCGHLGGKVLIPTSSFIKTLNSARLAADVMGVPSLIIARTDAEAARLITSDIDPEDHEFLTGERTAEGFYRLKEDGFAFAIKRAIAYAPYADLVWCETGTPDLAQARRFAEEVHKVHPDQMLAYNCSPSFNWAKHMGEDGLQKFQKELNAMGYKFQFVTLAGFHSLNMATFDLAYNYNRDGMAAYSKLQEREFDAEERGYTATRHQREVGTSYFDAVSTVINGAGVSTNAMAESTETAQF